MTNKKQKPAWWMLYLLVPLMIGLLLLETRLPFTPLEHTIAEIGIVLIVFGLMIVWLHVNQGALLQDELDKYPDDLVVHIYQPKLGVGDADQSNQIQSGQFSPKHSRSGSVSPTRRDPSDLNYPISRN